MASIRELTSGKWQVQVRHRGMRPVAKSFKTKTEATRFARLLEPDGGGNHQRAQDFANVEAIHPSKGCESSRQARLILGPSAYTAALGSNLDAFTRGDQMNEKIQRLDVPIPFNKIHLVWGKAYLTNRYLSKLSNEELRTRLADIVSNLMVLGEDGKYRPQFNLRDDGVYAPIRNLDFLRMMYDAVTEERTRGLSHRSRFEPQEVHLAKHLSDESWCRRTDWIDGSRLSVDKYERPKMLFRFSGAKWNRDFYIDGRLRVSPASTYADPNLGYARQDNELSREWHDNTGKSWDVSTDDYYCACFFITYDCRLYNDFPEDSERRSCVAIVNPSEFSARFRLV